MRVAVIPARGGSKRIPRKNIRAFAGQPMISWSIQAAQQSGCFDRILVSTDDDEIAEVAQRWGAEVPFRRPPELSDDHTATIPVIAHAIRWCQAQGWPVTWVCCVYATAPMVQVADIRAAYQQLLAQPSMNYAFPVVRFGFPIQRALRMDAQHGVSMFDPTQFQTRSQDLEPAWHDAGQFYWGKAAAWLDGLPIFTSGALAIELPAYRVQDIDTLDDWERAAYLFRALQLSAQEGKAA